MKKKIFILLLSFYPVKYSLSDSTLNEFQSCTNWYNQHLKDDIASGFVDTFILDKELKSSSHWGTSMLIPEKGNPKTIGSINKMNQKLFKKKEEYFCQYSPFQVLDGDIKTAWSEGVIGPGFGEILLVAIQTEKPLLIFSGFGKSKELYYANNRPKEIAVSIFEPTGMEKYPGKPLILTGLKLVAKEKIVLGDIFGYQQLLLPKHQLNGVKFNRDEPESSRKFYSILAIEILSVYQGSKYDDTLISEIKSDYLNE